MCGLILRVGSEFCLAYLRDMSFERACGRMVSLRSQEEELQATRKAEEEAAAKAAERQRQEQVCSTAWGEFVVFPLERFCIARLGVRVIV